jgi:nitroimidazol reductase NimA-like FMN-containing flavoprotein (pyridoxamine 5'-phosphate oxidase superfamily)
MEASVPQHVLDYLNEQKTLTLATVSSGGDPHASTLLFTSEGVNLYLWLKPNSRTADNVAAEQRVGFAIDEYSADWRQTKGVQGTGRCEPVTGEEIAKTAMRFGDKFPDLEPGGSTASIAFYRIQPDELEFIDNSGSEKDEGEFGFSYKRDKIY